MKNYGIYILFGIVITALIAGGLAYKITLKPAPPQQELTDDFQKQWVIMFNKCLQSIDCVNLLYEQLLKVDALRKNQE